MLDRLKAGIKGALDVVAKATSFTYDAINPRGRRRNTGSNISREDWWLGGQRKRAMQANSADLWRNLSLAAWMVRRHLDYVSQFSFYSRVSAISGVLTDAQAKALNAQIEALMEEDSRPENCDIAGKFGREKMFRLAECRRVLDGETLLVKLDDGRMQGIQADLIADPTDKGEGEQWIDGILITGVGRALAFGVKTRKNLSEEVFDRRINSTNVIHYGFFDRFAADQVHGISPLTAALNPLRDVYENFDYALAKSKISQLLAFVIYSDALEGAGEAYESQEPAPVDSQTAADVEASPADGPRYKTDFGKGPVKLELEPGDRAEMIESKNPSTEFQNFTQLVIQVALKALDIPYSFYDESHTNFFGSRAAWLHYERSCRDKRDDQIEMRRKYTIWKLQTWIRDGRLVLPGNLRISDLYWEWQPRGMPWWDPSKEVKGNIAAIAAGLDTPQRVCKAADTDYFDNIDQIAAAKEYAAAKGIALNWSVAPDVNITAGDNGQAQTQ